MSISRRHPADLAALVLAILVVAGACTSAASSAAPTAGQATTVPTAAPSAAPTAPPTPAPTVTAPPPMVTPSPSPSPVAAFPITLTDDEGATVVIPTRPARIVSLTPATTEILFAIGAGDRVAATTDFDDYPPEAVALPDVASYTAVDVEKIVALESDLVIAGGNSFNSPDAIAKLRSFGIPVLVVYGKDIDGVLADIRLVGAAAGEADAADALATAMKADFEAVSAAVAGRPTPRVFYELDASNGIFGPADGFFVTEMISRAGGDPITTGSPTVFSISLEKLVEADPEVILLGDAAYGVTPSSVAARPGWGTMTAVKSGAIHPVNDIVVTRPGPRLTEGLRALAGTLHPEVILPPPPSAAP